jgi:hypothetical protein
MAELKQNIMRRVYAIYAFRMVVPKVALLTVALFALKYFVSFVDVFRNMPSLADVSRSALFFWSAFAHTDIVVQASVLVTLGVFVFMVRDIARNAHMLSFAR